jgi:hypothetical protein
MGIERPACHCTCIAATQKSLANFQVMLELCELVTVHDAIHTVGVTVM